MEMKYELGIQKHMLKQKGITNYREAHSVFAPLVGARGTLVKKSGRLITWPNLDLHEVGAFIEAVVRVLALDFCVVHIAPGLFSAKHIVYLFAFEFHFVFKLVLHAEDVGAGLAEEAEVVECLLGK